MHEIELEVGDWARLGADATTVRNAVFAREQGIAALYDSDEADLDALHVVAYGVTARSRRALGTARLLREGAIGRLAVVLEARRGGVGSRLLQTLLAHAALRGHTEVRLYALCRVEPFYRRHGFVPVGEPFDAQGLAHIEMVRALPIRS